MNSLDEILEQILCKAYTKIIYSEEKILKDMIGDTLSLKEFHTLDVVNNAMANQNNTASNIAKILGITQGTLTTNIDRLAKKGYVNKVKHDSDRRITYINLTREGQNIRQKHENMHLKSVRNAIKNLSAAEKVALMNAMNKLDF